MSPVVGYATLQVIPSLKGVHESIRRALGDGAVGGAADQAGKSLGGRVGAGLSSAVASAGRVAMAGLESVALAGGVAASAALVKGWGRLTTIEDATTALTISLQDSGAAAALLGDVLDVVSGTPFNLDEFASGAQQLVGMGIEAEKVPGYLEAIGEAAATQGGRAQEMAGRLTTVFGQIAASGQVQLQDVWRISDTGVNALGILANSFGVTRDEMKDMISSGAVPAGEALDALAAGILEGTDGPAGATIALAGTMEALRGTMSGAVAGIEPAMARLGEAVIKPFAPAVVAGANGLVDSVDRLAEIAGDLAGRVAASDFLERLIDAASDGPAVVDRLVGGLSDLDGVATVLAGSLGGLASKGLGGLLSTVGIAVPGIGPLAGALGAIVLSSDDARDALGDLASDLLPIFGDMASSLEPFLDAVRDAAGDLIPALADVLIVVAEAAAEVLAVAGPLAADLLGLATPVLVAGLEAIAWALERTSGVLPYVAVGWAAIKAAQVAPAVWQRVSDAFDQIALKSYDMAGGLGQAASNAALFGGVAIAAVGLTAIWQGFERARRSAEQWRAEVEGGIDTSSIESYEQAIARADERIGQASQTVGTSFSGAWDAVKLGIKGTVELLTPLENEVIDAFYALEGAEETAAALRAQLRLLESQFDEVGSAVGLSRDEVQSWVDNLDLDPAALGVEGMTEAIGDAVAMAETGSPAVESLAGAVEVLGDEATTATDQVGALADALDAMIGTQVDAEQAALAWQEAINELSFGAQVAAEAGEVWSTNLAGLDEASLETRGVVAGLVDQAIDLALAFGEAGGGVEGATAKLMESREQIIASGEAAGIAREDMEDYLDTLGLTPENIETLIRAHTDRGSVDAANAALDWASRDRMARIRVAFDVAQREGVPLMVAEGGGSRRRWGGIHETARWGRLPAHVTQHPTILYGERETGGEAMIPRLGDKGRSKRILSQAAGWYGMDVVDSTSPVSVTVDQPIVLDGEVIGRNRRVYEGVARQAAADRRGR